MASDPSPTGDAPVVVVLFPPLHPLVPDAVAEVAPAAEVRLVTWELPHEARTRREQEPDAPDLAAGEPPVDEATRAALAAATVIVGLDVPLDVVELAPRLRWIQAIGSGVGQFQPCGLGPAGVTLTNSPGLAAPAIAEWVLARILQVYKRLDVHDAQARERVWQMAQGRQLAGSTAAVVGLGAIGRAVAVRLRALGVRTLATRRTAVEGDTDPDVDRLFPAADLAAMVAEADIVVAAAPGTPENEDLFDADVFAAMRPGALFVNVGRGTLVDEAALIAALESGRLGAAALDVTRAEPLPPDDPLWDAPRLFLSPHSSSSADRYMETATERFAANLERFLADRPLTHVVEPDRYA